VTSTSLTKILAEADRLYAGRSNIANVQKSVELLSNAADCFEITWRLARAFFFLGQEAPAPDVARSLHTEGVKAGQRAIAHQTDRVEGHFWLGVNLALLARLEPPIKAAKQALQAKRVLRRAIQIDATYHAAGPLRVLARLQHKLPRLLGGGSARALANFERALSIAPNNTVTRIYFAELLLDTDAFERARGELEVVLTSPSDPQWDFEIERDQRLAKELMKKLPSPL
jgi:tetratricopeptide (TPR) repeat protein